jgi:2Fe-2S ferredoxin
MPRIVFVQPDGTEKVVDAQVGASVMKAAIASAVPGIVGECGGDLVCATCHVYVGGGWADRLDPITVEEAEMLEVTSEEPTDESRLSCQVTMTEQLDGLTVVIPATQR